MNSGLFKKLVPHLIAIAIFLIITAIFCKPVLEGNVLNQTDITGWKGMSQNAFEYKAQHGHFPLWNPNLFSGMPNYQTAMEGKSVLPDIIRIIIPTATIVSMERLSKSCEKFSTVANWFGKRKVIKRHSNTIAEANEKTRSWKSSFMRILQFSL